MKTPYLNSLIDKLNTWKKNEDLNDEGEIGLKELIEIKRVLNLPVVGKSFKEKSKTDLDVWVKNNGYKKQNNGLYKKGINWLSEQEILKIYI